MPLVSFCFSTYKRGDILKETLLSVQRQTFTDFEVIISDNDPESSAKFYVDSMNDARFKYFANGINLGMKASFNKSLQRSTGEYIVMIADDDPVYSDMLETLVKMSNEIPGYGMYMGGCDWFCKDKDVAKLYNLKVGTNSCISDDFDVNNIRVFSTSDFLNNFYTLKIFKHFLWSTSIVKRDLLIKMGGIPDYGSPFLGDYAYMSIASTENGVVIVNRSLGCQTIHKENFGRNQNEQLPVVAANFPEFLNQKLNYLEDWPKLKKLMCRFTALWLIEHMVFLYHFKGNDNVQIDSLNEAKNKVFDIVYLKKYRLKFYLKKDFRKLHDFFVKIKRFSKV